MQSDVAVRGIFPGQGHDRERVDLAGQGERFVVGPLRLALLYEHDRVFAKGTSDRGEDCLCCGIGGICGEKNDENDCRVGHDDKVPPRATKSGMVV
jgi:hypothetical protein